MLKLLLLESGMIALDDDIIANVRFDKGSLIQEFTKIINREYDLSSIFVNLNDDLLTNDAVLNDLAKEYGLRSSLMSKEEIMKIQEQKIDLMIKAKHARDRDEAIALLREFAIKLSELKIREASTRRDLHIIQSINALDEYDKAINIASERIREWYGLHFPELSSIIDNINLYCDVVLAGDRYSLTLDRLSMDKDRGEVILKAARESKGGYITNDSMNVLKIMARDLKMLIKSRESIVRYLEKEMEEVAPNIKELVGANIGARIIAKAGGLDKLAMLPASTIQVLGAEKALFRALKTKNKPPKHGILFQHILVHGSPTWQRGKIARTLAANLALAARIDLYKGIRDPTLINRLTKRVEEIKERYKDMPKKVKEVKSSKKRRFKKRFEKNRR